jgi:hypothetical protein
MENADMTLDISRINEDANPKPKITPVMKTSDKTALGSDNFSHKPDNTQCNQDYYEPRTQK